MRPFERPNRLNAGNSSSSSGAPGSAIHPTESAIRASMTTHEEPDSAPRGLDYAATEAEGRSSSSAAAADGGSQDSPVPVFVPATGMYAQTVPLGPTRDETATAEEVDGSLTFCVITNDGHPQHAIWLVGAKCIFSQQLPKMPREYIVRLVMDRRHRTLLALKGGRVVGAICYRPFFDQNFAEIAFCAVTSSEQVRGYGTRLMNHLKMALMRDGVTDMLTYADNFATGYFKKQGFTAEIHMDPKRWKGYIKDYEGGTLMHCAIAPGVDYRDVPGMLRRQRAALIEAIKLLAPGVASSIGLDSSTDQPVARLLSRSELQAAAERKRAAGEGSSSSADAPPTSAADSKPLGEKLEQMTQALQGLQAAWPFLEPVNPDEVKGYAEAIAEPMDLSTVMGKVKSGAYLTLEDYAADVALIIDNCRSFNAPGSVFSACADKLEMFAAARLAKLRD
jgi:histone acetyltransferase